MAVHSHLVFLTAGCDAARGTGSVRDVSDVSGKVTGMNTHPYTKENWHASS